MEETDAPAVADRRIRRAVANVVAGKFDREGLEPFERCPWSNDPDFRGESHPHNAGYGFSRRTGRCAVCGKSVRLVEDYCGGVLVRFRLARG
ncbi:MAG TPA: hypothetical protein VGG32_11190 [Thermoplasmata archaeon]|jgi:hypothetical protein